MHPILLLVITKVWDSWKTYICSMAFGQIEQPLPTGIPFIELQYVVSQKHILSFFCNFLTAWNCAFHFWIFSFHRITWVCHPKLSSPGMEWKNIYWGILSLIWTSYQRIFCGGTKKRLGIHERVLKKFPHAFLFWISFSYIKNHSRFSDGVASMSKSLFEVIQDIVDGVISDEDFESNAGAYTVCTPRTKESYYYR